VLTTKLGYRARCPICRMWIEAIIIVADIAIGARRHSWSTVYHGQPGGHDRTIDSRPSHGILIRNQSGAERNWAWPALPSVCGQHDPFVLESWIFTDKMPRSLSLLWLGRWSRFARLLRRSFMLESALLTGALGVIMYTLHRAIRR
jgi:hypothetical protein